MTPCEGAPWRGVLQNEVIGLQWQLDSAAAAADGGAPTACDVEVCSDDIDVITR